MAEQINNTILINPYEEGLERYKLQPTQLDRLDFNHIIDEGSPNYQKTLINRCYRFFGTELFKHQEIQLNLLKTAIISGLSLVSITLDQDENPHLIFESLNAKGKPLTQADLIRNYFFMRIDVDQQEETYDRYWLPMQNNLDENNFDDGLTECIRHYLMKNDLEVNENEVYLELKKQVNPNNALESLQDLTKFASYYHKLIKPSQETNKSISNCLMRLERLDIKSIYPFLLNCYEDYIERKLSVDEFVKVLNIIENFLIRRFVCNFSTDSLNKVFSSLYREINETNQKTGKKFMEGLKFVLTDKKDSYPRDDEFQSRLKDAELYDSDTPSKRERCKLILESIEQSFNHQEKVSFNNLTIEHIMPQMPKGLSEDWQKSLGEDWEKTHQLFLHTLGNLTLTGYNSELSHNIFSKKREILLESKLKLNESFSDKKTWQRKDIEERAEYLSEICLKIWPYFGSASQKRIPKPKKPKTLSILGKKSPVKSWREVLETTMNTIAELTHEDEFQELVREYPRFVNWNYQKFREYRKLTNGAFIAVKLSGKEINSFCLKAIERIGLSSEDWQVET